MSNQILSASICVYLRLRPVVAAQAALGSSVIQSCNFAHGRQRFGLRWQSAAATPLSVGSQLHPKAAWLPLCGIPAAVQNLWLR
ncbi:MAG: hypothetical protein ACLPYZ_02010, partial [Limisphaerales bacterium]